MTNPLPWQRSIERFVGWLEKVGKGQRSTYRVSPGSRVPGRGRTGRIPAAGS